MPHRIRPPSAADASAVLDVIHARDVAGVPPAPDVPLRTFEPADEGLAGAALGERWVRTVWEAQRWEKPLGHA
jgi:hypothetical protein